MFLIFDISILAFKKKKKIWKAFDYFQRNSTIFEKNK